MFTNKIKTMAGLAVLAAALAGCAAETPLSVAPGQGKSYTDLQQDDAYCRSATAPQPQATATNPAAPTAAGGNYYQCMQARGELIVANRAVPYPVYAGYPYYGYPYPYYGYPWLGGPYPYPAAYFGPFVGVGIGFGYGYGGRFFHGERFGGHDHFGGGFGHGGGFHH